MARIRHMAVKTADVPKLADFYKNVFGLTEVSRGKRSIYLSDGTSTWRFSPQRVDRRASITSVSRWKIPKRWPTRRSKPAPGRGRAICRAMADSPRCLSKIPQGQRVDLSKQGWKT